MIAAILAAALATGAIPAGANEIQLIPACAAGISVPCIEAHLGSEQTAVTDASAVNVLLAPPPLSMSAEGSLVFAYPPCGTPAAANASACVRWMVDPTNPRAIGYLPPVRVLSPGQ